MGFPFGRTIIWKSNAAKTSPRIAEFGESLMAGHLKKTTRTTYDSSMKLFWRWAAENNIPLEYPIKPADLLMFAAHRAYTGRQYPPISKDLSAIRKSHIERGIEWERHLYPQLQTLLSGIYRISGGDNFDEKIPFTTSILQKVVPLFNLMDFNHLVALTVIEMAMMGLLRVSEYAQVSADKNNPKRPLRVGDVAWVPSEQKCDYIVLNLREEKGKKGARGNVIPIGRTSNHQMCAITMLKRMLNSRRSLFRELRIPALDSKNENYLFVWNTGNPVSTGDVNKILKSIVHAIGLDKSKFSPHCLRIGGATSLARRNAKDSSIWQLGRWQRICFGRYTRLSNPELARLTNVMICGKVAKELRNVQFNFRTH